MEARAKLYVTENQLAEPGNIFCEKSENPAWAAYRVPIGLYIFQKNGHRYLTCAPLWLETCKRLTQTTLKAGTAGAAAQVHLVLQQGRRGRRLKAFPPKKQKTTTHSQLTVGVLGANGPVVWSQRSVLGTILARNLHVTGTNMEAGAIL